MNGINRVHRRKPFNFNVIIDELLEITPDLL